MYLLELYNGSPKANRCSFQVFWFVFKEKLLFCSLKNENIQKYSGTSEINTIFFISKILNLEELMDGVFNISFCEDGTFCLPDI